MTCRFGLSNFTPLGIKDLAIPTQMGSKSTQKHNPTTYENKSGRTIAFYETLLMIIWISMGMKQEKANGKNSCPVILPLLRSLQTCRFELPVNTLHQDTRMQVYLAG